MDFLKQLMEKSIAPILLLAVLLVAMNIGIEQLTDADVNAAAILTVRSGFNLAAGLGIALLRQQSIVPQAPRLQAGAFIMLGLSLLLVFTAYEYISAGSVSTLQRLDIPLLALAGMYGRQLNLKQAGLATGALALVGALLLLNQTTDEDPLGYMLVLGGVAVISMNTLVQKKLAMKENIETIIVIASLSSLCWGALRCWQTGVGFDNLTAAHVLTIFVLSVINLVIFYLVNTMYKKHAPEMVRYPYLLAAFLTMMAEMVVEHKVFNGLLIGGNIAILLVITLLVHAGEYKSDGTEH